MMTVNIGANHLTIGHMRANVGANSKFANHLTTGHIG